MRSLSSFWRIVYIVSTIFLLIGAALPLLGGLTLSSVSLFCIGVIGFTWGHVLQVYDGVSLTLRRLRRQQLIGCGFFVLTAILMFLRLFHFPPFYGDVWKVTLGIGTVFYAYTVFRISSEIEKEIK